MKTNWDRVLNLGEAVLVQAQEDEDTDWIFSDDPEVAMWVDFWCDVAGIDPEDFRAGLNV